MLYLLLIVATFATSVLSGVLSMAGGMILMGLLSLFLPVPTAMVLHGIAQAASNGSRVWLYRRAIRWNILGPYSLGALLVLGIFSLLVFVPDKGVVFLLIGLSPFAAMALPASLTLDIEQPTTAFTCGVLVTGAQMLAGASGPVLDVFYVNSPLSRQAVLGTKAITQTLGHILKTGYYLGLLALADAPHWLFVLGIIAAALAGNGIGSLVITRMNDDQFRRLGRRVVLVIGAAYVIKGLAELAGP